MDPSVEEDAGAGDCAEQDVDTTTGDMLVDEMSLIPAEMKQHLDFIDIKKDGQLLLGASSLTSRYWTGDVWLFDSPDDAPDLGLFRAARQLESGVPCGRFIDGLGMRAVVGQDLGAVEVLGWEEPEEAGGGRQLVTHGRSAEQDGGVLSLDLVPAGAAGDPDADAVRAVTGMTDGSVRVWDLETLVPEVCYTNAHAHWVTGVTSHPAHAHQLLSCGLDGALLLWDTRAARPARQLASSASDRPTCCSWSPSDYTTVAVGWESGRVSLLNPVSGAETAETHRSRPVHRLRWHPSRAWLAACGDQTSVQVYTASDTALKSRHEDTLHWDMARDLAWLPGTDTLYSCGWDKQVFSRAVV